MITHEYEERKVKWHQTLLWDFVIPLSLVVAFAYFLDKKLAKGLLQLFINVPVLGYRLYHSAFFVQYVRWHFLIFFTPVFLIAFAVSFRTARIPGPGRAFLRWWQGLLHLKLKKAVHVNPFPPKFDRTHPKTQKLIETLEGASPNSRVIGYFKRFASDIQSERRRGVDTESPSDYFPIVITEKQRYRHIQVVGGSGSGKSASVPAQMMLRDIAMGRLATLTLNPKADLYFLKVFATGVLRRNKNKPKVPVAVISFSRPDTLSYDPFLYGDADALTKKILGSSEISHDFFKPFGEAWLLTFFRVMKTEPLLLHRLMLRHLHRYLTRPKDLLKDISPLCQTAANLQRVEGLAAANPESLAGLASHVALFVEDESLTRIFDNPQGKMLDVRDVLLKGGHIFIDASVSTKGPQARALGRMLLMEIQLLAGARQEGSAPKDIGIQLFLDEIGAYAYNGLIDGIDKARSSDIGFLVCHQSLGNLKRDNLSKSFKDELVDNCHTKIFLAVDDETAAWASRLLGTRKVIKESLSIGHATGTTDTRARENQTLSLREEMELYVEPSGFNLGLGYGYAALENAEGRLMKVPVRLGYVDQTELCTDAELSTLLREALQSHPTRPRNGSLIDNKIPPGEAEGLETETPPNPPKLPPGIGGALGLPGEPEKDKPDPDGPASKDKRLDLGQGPGE